MDFNLKLRSNIDSNFVDMAEEELFQILLKQHLSSNKRWDLSHFSSKIIPILRNFGILLSIFGIVISIIFMIRPDSCSTTTQMEYYIDILFFIVMGLVFYFIPWFFPRLQNFGKDWTETITIKNCRNISRRCVKKARKLAPYQAEYDIKENLITCYRGKNDILKLAWTGKLKGVAIHGKLATIFLKKWTSIQPTMVILHEDFYPLETVLKNQHIDFRSKDRTTEQES
jgi:hypothetical protein